jgi:hypothetical protein
MNNTKLVFDEISSELFSDKLENTYWSEVNKRYLLRIYHPLKIVMEFVSTPKWSDVMWEMIGRIHPGYYSCVYKSLKEIGVIKYNPTTKCLEKGPNWERFYSDEDWSWFYMNTSSGMESYEVVNVQGLKVRKIYKSNYRNNK